MNSKIKLIPLSDLHLEKKSPEQAKFLVDLINEEVKSQQSQGYKPVVLLAGDVHNGIKAYEWMKHIQTTVLYVAGNHEFWDGDFYEVNEKLISRQPYNVHYLYNDTFLLDDTIFIGSTLWTDIGQGTNPDILTHATFSMNDNFYSTAQKWYENPDNIVRIQALLKDRAHEFIDNKRWNVLAELDENKKTQSFLKSFNAVHELLTHIIPNEKSTLEREVNSSYKPLDPVVFEQKMSNLLIYTSDITLWEYLKLNNFFEKEYIDSPLDKELLQPNDTAEKIFKKFQKIDLKNKKIVMLSHHLPFMEEALIGRHQNHVEKPALFNNLNEKIFLINKGHDYPYHNYFFQIAKGEIAKHEDITMLSHYCNSSSMFDERFLAKLDLWVHGHEHMYNYQDYVKGIKIVTNPIGYALHNLKFENGKIQLSEKFKKTYPQNTEQKWNDYLVQLKKSIIQPVEFSSNSKEDIINAWSWYLWSRQQYMDNTKELLHISKKLSGILSKRIQGNSVDSYQINLHALAFNHLLENVKKQEKNLQKAKDIRQNVGFTFQRQAYDLLDNQSNSSFDLHLKNSYEKIPLNLHYLKEGFDLNPFDQSKRPNTYGFHECYFNTIQLTYGLQKVEKISALFEGHEFLKPEDIPKSIIEELNKLDDHSYKDTWKMSEKLESRYYKTLNNLTKKYQNKNPPGSSNGKMDF